MTYAVYLPLLLPALVALAARYAGDRFRPAGAAVGLTAAALLTAAASTWALLLLVLTLFDDLPTMVARNARLHMTLPEPVPDAVALVAGLALLVALARLARELYRRHDAVRRLRTEGPAAGGVVLADWTEPLAVAVPGRRGHILLTTGMTRLLSAPERAAVLAHERAHLRRHHHVLITAAAAAAALNPLLIVVRDAVAYLAERWADEDAARTVGDRDLVARAVARAALATSPRAPAATLGVHGGVIVRRVRALHSPPPPAASRAVLAGLAAAAATGVVTGVIATSDFVHVLVIWLRA